MTGEPSGPLTGSGRLPATSLVACKVAPISGRAPAMASQWRAAPRVAWDFLESRMAWMLIGPGLAMCVVALGLLGVDRELLCSPSACCSS